MSAAIQFYFDFSSPYGYFASAKIDEIAARHGRDVTWHPILLGAIFKITGAVPLPQLPLKGDYYKHDFLRSARWFGIPYKLPSVFPIGSVAPSRAFYWLNETNPRQAKELAQHLYRAFFVEDVDISQVNNTLAVAASMGIDEASLEAGLREPAIKDKLKSEVQAAIDKGVFGSPYFIVDGEPFHGSDRMEQMERWLVSGGW